MSAASAAAIGSMLTACADIVGSEWVLHSAEDLKGYEDNYALAPAAKHAAGGVVAPANTDELQKVLRIANDRRIAIWPISRGKNLGYGSAAPVMKSTVVLDLSRMNKILEVNEKLAYCVVEPGVGFYELQDYLDQNKIKLWMSHPGQASGSVMGNALEHGCSTTPNGDHAQQICGMEIMLANGDIVRTGMGAMEKPTNWHLFKHGYGPGWDQVFTQSNFGIVTKMGLWLLPEPEATMTLNMDLDEVDSLRWIVDALGPLRTNGVIRQACSIRNFMREGAMRSQRSQWYEGKGAMPDSAIEQLRKELKVGWWNINLRLHGPDAVNRANADVIQRAVEPFTPKKFELTRWVQGDPRDKSGHPRPGMRSMHMMNWTGGRGGHVTFSPVMPLDGTLAYDHFKRMRARMSEFGFDYYGSIYLWERSVTVISQIFFDQDDQDAVARLNKLFPALIADGHQFGYGEYRTHIDFMDAVARSFDFNDHAMIRLNQAFKAAVDPNGIIAPGKQGIWPHGQGQLA